MIPLGPFPKNNISHNTTDKLKDTFIHEFMQPNIHADTHQNKKEKHIKYYFCLYLYNLSRSQFSKYFERCPKQKKIKKIKQFKAEHTEKIKVP